MAKISGNCLCEKVTFTMETKFKNFYQCHCHQCQRITGSAFASNLFTSVDNIQWLSGEDNITHYSHPEREFSKSFCQSCGSPLPFKNKKGTVLIVPAGCLSPTFTEKPRANIFVKEKACWTTEEAVIPAFDGFPK